MEHNIKNRMDGLAITEHLKHIINSSRKLTIDFKEEGFTQDDIIKYITQIVRTEVDYQFNNSKNIEMIFSIEKCGITWQMRITSKFGETSFNLGEREVLANIRFRKYAKAIKKANPKSLTEITNILLDNSSYLSLQENNTTKESK